MDRNKENLKNPKRRAVLRTLVGGFVTVVTASGLTTGCATVNENARQNADAMTEASILLVLAQNMKNPATGQIDPSMAALTMGVLKHKDKGFADALTNTLITYEIQLSDVTRIAEKYTNEASEKAGKLFAELIKTPDGRKILSNEFAKYGSSAAFFGTICPTLKMTHTEGGNYSVTCNGPK